MELTGDDRAAVARWVLRVLEAVRDGTVEPRHGARQICGAIGYAAEGDELRFRGKLLVPVTLMR